MKTILIKPAPGCLIRDPVTRIPLSETGEEKPFTPFWCRRLDDGDVIQLESLPESEAPVVTEENSDNDMAMNADPVMDNDPESGPRSLR
ncbi:DUF2635 domain-containing protein [Escherichia coli]|uniref:DUF2635 domain-containing protein n=1 Tax=Escherichia coli TaxID=562 RepID=UPI000BBE8BA6|nr:DUF2635 domain-containing protein [Escherichia coli]EFF2350600.1 DUF2635 domain-containing protein [Escherichia coli]EFH3062599.1 DUF2635 domain-containing protein [Escherichia coli]EFH8136829.1 DUF2635 domain-containing protein [Escherichia coli]EFO0235287.1 DUF2635 domain-containing protein [Escherichia coli]EHH4388543.1 DUF2635 domain-containing protein [Escherichia coli]